MAGWKDKFTQARGKAGLLKQAALEQGVATLEQHWQVIRALWLEKVDPSIRSTVMDDEKLTACLRLVHEALPLPLRLAVKEETFIRVCLKHRDRWLPAGQDGVSPARQAPGEATPVLASPQQNGEPETGSKDPEGKAP